MKLKTGRRTGVVAIAALIGALAVGGTTSSAATAAPVATPLDACVAKYSTPATGLAKGQAVARSKSGGAVAAGDAGLTVTETATPTTAAGDAPGSGEVSVELGDVSDMAAQANAYRAAGRTVLDDARAAGLSKKFIRGLCQKQIARASSAQTSSASALTAAGGGVYASACAKDTSSQVRWEGCAERHSVPDSDATYNYGIDDAQASGEETSVYAALVVGGVRNEYNSSYVDITKASPNADISDVDRCFNSSFGISMAGVGVNAGGTVCPARWDITKTSISAVPEYHRTEWKGMAYDQREAIAISGIRVRAGKSTGYSFHVNWKYSA